MWEESEAAAISLVDPGPGRACLRTAVFAGASGCALQALAGGGTILSAERKGDGFEGAIADGIDAGGRPRGLSQAWGSAWLRAGTGVGVLRTIHDEGNTAGASCPRPVNGLCLGSGFARPSATPPSPAMSLWSRQSK
ncbi:hypothetical protein DL765_000568 [Monosporascus sp. GIB2]|nr:hypothetical protein DL765_000568 [Monosporascus sp. GIB2]